jgi:hypothetical protein
VPQFGCDEEVVIAAYSEATGAIFSSPFDTFEQCARDLVSNGTDIILLTQKNFNPPNAKQTFFRGFNQNLVKTRERQGPTMEFIAQAMSTNWEDPDTVFVLDTNYGNFNRVLRISLSSGQIVAFSQVRPNEGSFITRDIAHYPDSNEVIMYTLDPEGRKYRLTAYDDVTLVFTRELTFTY